MVASKGQTTQIEMTCYKQVIVDTIDEKNSQGIDVIISQHSDWLSMDKEIDGRWHRYNYTSSEKYNNLLSENKENLKELGDYKFKNYILWGCLIVSTATAVYFAINGD